MANAANIIHAWKGAVEPGTVLTDQIVTNQWISSNDLTDAGLATNDATIVSDDTTAPDGTVDADSLQATAQSGAQQPTIRDTSLLLSEYGQMVLSCYAKKDSVRYMVIDPALYGAVTTSIFDFDSPAFALTGVGAVGVGWELATITYPDAPAGWYRLWVAFLATTDTSGRPQFGISKLPTIHRINDPTTADRNWVWGCQLERGLTPGPLVETSGAAVTERVRTFGAATVTNVIQLFKGAVEPGPLTAAPGVLSRRVMLVKGLLPQLNRNLLRNLHN